MKNNSRNLLHDLSIGRITHASVGSLCLESLGLTLVKPLSSFQLLGVRRSANPLRQILSRGFPEHRALLSNRTTDLLA